MCDLRGLESHHASIYPFAVSVLRKVIEKEGSFALNKAAVFREKLNVCRAQSRIQKEPSFENPVIDTVSLEVRDSKDEIVFLGLDGKITRPFAMPFAEN